MSKSEQELLASLLLSTRRKKRLFDLIQVAEEINALKKKLGSLEMVSHRVGISKDMLNQFLSVLKLNPQVRQLVKERKIDSVSFVRHLNRFSQEDQILIAEGYMGGHINTQDIRALGPLRTKYPDMQIKNLIEKLKKSKDIRISVAYFQIPAKKFDDEIALKNIIGLIGDENFISFEKKGLLGKLKITAEGEFKLRLYAKKKKSTLRNFLHSLIKS